MKRSGTIFKDKILRPSQDFAFLKAQGMKYVQGFSGDIWTDYNLHDPGLTILEQFCYGVTDLGYRIAFPIEDLLVENSDGRINWEKNSFYSPALVFSSHPITISDFRKLFIDTFSEIQNCWLYPVFSQGGEEGVNGLFQLEVLPSLSFQKELEKKSGLAESFLNRLQVFLHQNRNLGEDFVRPILLRPYQIYLEVNVEATPETDPDQLMAEILFGLDVHLYHPVAFANFEELQQEGKRLEEIFSGPRLSRGFIRDSELKPRSKELYAERFLQLISKIEGVKKCWNLKIDQEGKVKKLTLPDNSFASINTEVNDTESVYSTIEIYVNGNLQRVNKTRVSDLLLDLWSKNFRMYQEDLFRESYWQSSLIGNFRNPGEYRSIQHLFPRIYGLGKEGISKHESPERHAKIRQLKGYLMLMERHLANFLAQLTHLSDFFDPDVDTHQGTYFSQDYETQIGQDELEIKSTLTAGFDSTGVNPQTGESRLTWLRRKNKVFDHLLARFGEGVNEAPFQLALKLNLLGNEEEMLAALMLQKSRFLRGISELNYGKQRAVSINSKESHAFSTLEETLCLTLGIERKNGSLIPKFLREFLPDSEGVSVSDFLRSRSSYQDLVANYRPLSKSEKSFPQLLETLEWDFSLGKIGVRDLYSKTIDPESYWLSKESSKGGEVEVIFQKSESNWVSLWKGRDEASALRMIAQNIQTFRKINNSSEGMILVDHILLKEILAGTQFGFQLQDEWGDPTFQSRWSGTEEDRKVLLQKFYVAALRPEAYLKTARGITLVGEAGEELGVFAGAKLPDLREIIESTSSLSRMMLGQGEISGILALREVEGLRLKGTLHKKGLFRQRAVILTRKQEDGREIREDFFDLKASLVLPDWPARFQDSHFRFFLSNELKERVPAHMNVGVHWLNLTDFGAFEATFQKWISHKKEPSGSKKSLDHAHALYSLLSELKGGDYAK